MRLVKLVTLLFCILAISGSICAQTSGSIRGEIQDADGQPLSGAVVTIESTALIGGSRTAYTNELGVFRFPSVPIGTYSVEVTLDGFEKVRAENVLVKLDSSAYLRLKMKMVGAGEQISVVRDIPLIDPTDSGKSTSFKDELLRELPTQRGMWDLMQVAPGVTVDHGGDQFVSVIALGSNRQSNSWNIDGVDVTAPETGDAWWYINPDLIEEIQVIGIGAPAEYGNHTGAVLNVVTKKGSNELHGGLNYFFQHDRLTDNNVVPPNSSFGFHRDKYGEFSAQLGGPIWKNRLWFFGGFQHLRDASSPPGVDPSFAPLLKSDKYDIKVSGRLGTKNEVSGFYHNEKYVYPGTASQFVAPSATGVEDGTNPSWGATFLSTISSNSLLELNYAGWTGDDFWSSATGSLDDPFINNDESPAISSGGTLFPFDYSTSRHQLKAKTTYYAEDFLKSQHEFRFGVQYSHGTAETLSSLGPNGAYLLQNYGSTYEIYQRPYIYGGSSNDFGVFVDDTVTVNDRFNLNLGIRFDHNRGSISEFEKLAVGTPSITKVANWVRTGERLPGVDNIIDWKLISPRLGFVYQTDPQLHSVIQASFGVYYDHNVIGNWDAPPPESPAYQIFILNPDTGQFEFHDEIPTQIPGYSYNKNLKPPRTLQYAVGYEKQFFNDSALGIQYVYKDTKDLIGWEILGGKWESVPFTDPFTGKVYTLLRLLENPLIRKGNDPGDFPGSDGLRYFQKYHGVILTFEKRFSNDWALNASYTWSRSTGLIPRMLDQFQFVPFYANREGSDPNNFINAIGRLQGDRPHMFRLQGGFFNLPGGLQASASVDISSGRAHSRQIQRNDLGQPVSTVIMEPTGSHRYSPVQNIDISIGRRFDITDKVQMRIDGWIYNLLNSDQELFFATLVLDNPSQTFVPDTWVKPRRLQVRFGLEF